jgi:hypothetical protein
MTNESQPKVVTTDHYFGGCPQCGDTDGMRNVGRDHWYFCAAHRTKWTVGANLFSGWRDENPAIWAANARWLEKFSEVEPVLPARDDDWAKLNDITRRLERGDLRMLDALREVDTVFTASTISTEFKRFEEKAITGFARAMINQLRGGYVSPVPHPVVAADDIEAPF